ILQSTHHVARGCSNDFTLFVLEDSACRICDNKKNPAASCSAGCHALNPSGRCRERIESQPPCVLALPLREDERQKNDKSQYRQHALGTLLEPPDVVPENFLGQGD